MRCGLLPLVAYHPLRVLRHDTESGTLKRQCVGVSPAVLTEPPVTWFSACPDCSETRADDSPECSSVLCERSKCPECAVGLRYGNCRICGWSVVAAVPRLAPLYPAVAGGDLIRLRAGRQKVAAALAQCQKRIDGAQCILSGLPWSQALCCQDVLAMYDQAVKEAALPGDSHSHEDRSEARRLVRRRGELLRQIEAAVNVAKRVTDARLHVASAGASLLKAWTGILDAQAWSEVPEAALAIADDLFRRSSCDDHPTGVCLRGTVFADVIVAHVRSNYKAAEVTRATAGSR